MVRILINYLFAFRFVPSMYYSNVNLYINETVLAFIDREIYVDNRKKYIENYNFKWKFTEEQKHLKDKKWDYISQ